MHPCLRIGPFQNVSLSDVMDPFFMCPTSILIYVDYWKSLVKFVIKKSHEMTSYVRVRMTLLTERNHGTPTKPCNLVHMTLTELYYKSYKRFMLSKCLENASIAL